MRDISGIGPRGAYRALAGIFISILILAAPAMAWSPAAVSIAASNSSSVALLDDGTVWQWGISNGVAWSTPHKIDIAGVRQIAAGNDHVLALKADGTVWAWGSNAHGQLGDGTTNDSFDPVQVSDLSGVKAISAGKDHSLALKGDGTVWAWGSNSYGQVGEGSLNFLGTTTPIRINGIVGITAISAGGSHDLFLQSDGTVWAMGDNQHGILGDGTNVSRFTPYRSKIRDIIAMDAGQSGHALAVKQDGAVWAWGFNYKGQLGAGGESLSDLGRVSLGPEADRYNPDIVRGVSDAKAVAAGGSHSVALASDGTVWAWGSNIDGQLGQGTTGGNDQTSPVQVNGLSGIKAISAGMYHTLALKDDGSVWAWGSNSDGQIGNATASSTSSPVLVLMGTQIPPPATPSPVIASALAITTAPSPGGINYWLAGAICVLILLAAAIIAAAYLLVFNKKKKE